MSPVMVSGSAVIVAAPSARRCVQGRAAPRAATMRRRVATQARQLPTEQRATTQPQQSFRNASPAEAAATDSANMLLFSSPAALLFLLAEDGGYSQASYYTTLGLFLMSFPGLYSLVKRSPQAKIKRKTFEVPGPSADVGAMALDDRARSMFTYFKRNNYALTEQGEVVTFEGQVKPDRGTASYIVFCAVIGLLAAGLVLSISIPAIGDSAYFIALLAPFAGVYYWSNAERNQVAKLKMVCSDDEKTTDIIVEADESEIERFAMELKFVEKGKIYVKGIFEQ